MRQYNIHQYIYKTALILYPHMDISMDISMDIHIRGKPAKCAAAKDQLQTIKSDKNVHVVQGFSTFRP